MGAAAVAVVAAPTVEDPGVLAWPLDSVDPYAALASVRDCHSHMAAVAVPAKAMAAAISGSNDIRPPAGL